MKGEIINTFATAKGGERMESIHTEWQVRCAFNSFCKKVLKHGAINAYKQRHKRKNNSRHR